MLHSSTVQQHSFPSVQCYLWPLAWFVSPLVPAGVSNASKPRIVCAVAFERRRESRRCTSSGSLDPVPSKDGRSLFLPAPSSLSQSHSRHLRGKMTLMKK